MAARLHIGRRREALNEHLRGKRTKIRSSKYLTDVFDKSLFAPASESGSFFQLALGVFIPTRDGSDARSDLKAGRKAIPRHSRFWLDGASTALSFASCGMDGD